MEHIEYKTHGTCSREIIIDIDPENGTITDAKFVGGCSGNTQGVCALVRGMRVEEAISRLEGIRCGMKQTSCPDQLARFGILEAAQAMCTSKNAKNRIYHVHIYKIKLFPKK